jgi:PAS domain S-box-containing protein
MLKNSNAESDLRRAIDVIPQLIWSAFPGGEVDFCNQSWLEYTGLTAEQSQGRGWIAAIHPEDRDELVAMWGRLLAGGVRGEVQARMRMADGNFRWFLIRAMPQRDDQGRIVKWYGTSTDIDDRKRAEEALASTSWKLIEAQEQERARIARELHDDIGQRLALLINDIDGLGKDSPDSAIKLRNPFHKYSKRLLEIADDVQAISHRLHSSKLRYLGIVVAAKSFCREFSEQHKVETNFTHADIPLTVPDEISLCLFRVLQEAMQNAVKHSGVQHFEVELRAALEEIHLTVRDLGRGFDPEAVMNNRGLGLISMQERVNLVKGTFSIDSRPDAGTTIHVRVPLNRKGHSAGAANSRPASL